MDNRINENRKKIRLLRAQMLDAEAVIRGQIGRDEDYTENSVGLMAMRAEMSELSKERARLGDDKEPILVERLMHQRRPPAARRLSFPRSVSFPRGGNSRPSGPDGPEIPKLPWGNLSRGGNAGLCFWRDGCAVTAKGDARCFRP